MRGQGGGREGGRKGRKEGCVCLFAAVPVCINYKCVCMVSDRGR